MESQQEQHNAVMEDWEYRKTRVGEILAGHDFASDEMSVEKAIWPIVVKDTAMDGGDEYSFSLSHALECWNCLLMAKSLTEMHGRESRGNRVWRDGRHADGQVYSLYDPSDSCELYEDVLARCNAIFNDHYGSCLNTFHSLSGFTRTTLDDDTGNSLNPDGTPFCPPEVDISDPDTNMRLTEEFRPIVGGSVLLRWDSKKEIGMMCVVSGWADRIREISWNDGARVEDRVVYAVIFDICEAEGLIGHNHTETTQGDKAKFIKDQCVKAYMNAKEAKKVINIDKY